MEGSQGERYEAIEIPEDLSFATESAVTPGQSPVSAPPDPSGGWGRRSGHLRLLLPAGQRQPCLCQRRVLSLFWETWPGSSRWSSIRSTTGNILIDVRLPALTDTGNTDLEQRINTEIRTRIDQVLAEAEERAWETWDAFVPPAAGPRILPPLSSMRTMR